MPENNLNTQMIEQYRNNLWWEVEAHASTTSVICQENMEWLSTILYTFQSRKYHPALAFRSV